MSEITTDSIKKDEADIAHYQRSLMYMSGDVPIQVLSLPKTIEEILIAEGCIRVYDLFSRDIKGIKGIGDKRYDLITAILNESFSVCI